MLNTESREQTQVYELCYLILPSIPEENLPQVVANIQEVIEKEGGKKIDSEDPFLHELAYEMSKTIGASRYVVKNAYIGWVKFGLSLEGGPEKHPVETIKEKVEKMAEVLRFLLVKAPRETKFTFASTRIAKEETLKEIIGEELPELLESPEEEILDVVK